MSIVIGQNRFFVDEYGKVKDLTDTHTGLVARLRYFEQYGLLDELPGTEELGKAATAIEALADALAALVLEIDAGGATLASMRQARETLTKVQP